MSANKASLRAELFKCAVSGNIPNLQRYATVFAAENLTRMADRMERRSKSNRNGRNISRIP